MVAKLLLLSIGLVYKVVAQTPGTFISFGAKSPGVSSPSPGQLRLASGYSEGGAVSSAALQSGQGGGVVFKMPFGAAANSTSSPSIRIGLGTQSSPSSALDRYYYECADICTYYSTGGSGFMNGDTYAVLVSNGGEFQLWAYGYGGSQSISFGDIRSGDPLYVHVWITGQPQQGYSYSWIDGNGDLVLPTTLAPTYPTTTVVTTTSSTTTHTLTTTVQPPSGGSSWPLLFAAASLGCLAVGGTAWYIVSRCRQPAPAREANVQDRQSMSLRALP